jgi:hypothetical protein
MYILVSFNKGELLHYRRTILRLKKWFPNTTICWNMKYDQFGCASFHQEMSK